MDGVDPMLDDGADVAVASRVGVDAAVEASVLEAAHLKKTYGKRTVVHDVSLKVRSGEVVGLLGPNGAGKTTCFYMMLGLVGAASLLAGGLGLAGLRLAVPRRGRLRERAAAAGAPSA